MTYAGARGETAAEMKKVLHFTLADEKLHAAMGGVTDSFQTAGKNRAYQLNIANALWNQQGMKLLPGFLDVTAKHYGAGVREVDFIAKREETRGTINKWVEDQTQDKIKELLKKGDINGMTRMVLTNAVYFQGKWKQQFDVNKTRSHDFEIEPGKKVQVPMMNEEEMKVRSSGTTEFSLIELPYQGDRWRMVLLLPAKRHGLMEVEAKLTEKSLSEAFSRFQAHELPIAIPKFKFRFPCYLKNQLSELGMPTTFAEGKADFSRMTEQAQLWIDNVIHQAMIVIDEEGTVAAAATAVTMKTTSARRGPCYDQPFLVILRDNATGTILFMGRVNDPR
jgi:serpin B